MPRFTIVHQTPEQKAALLARYEEQRRAREQRLDETNAIHLSVKQLLYEAGDYGRVESDWNPFGGRP